MMLFPSFIKHFCTLRQTVVFIWCISTTYCMYVALFYIKKKIEDVLIFNISLFTALLLEEISTHFSCEKITESSDRFFSNYSLLGLTLNFFCLSPLLYHFPTQFLFCAGWMICLKGLEMRSKLNFIPSYSFNDHSWLLHDYCLTCQNQSPSSGHIICGIKGGNLIS